MNGPDGRAAAGYATDIGDRPRSVLAALLYGLRDWHGALPNRLEDTMFLRISWGALKPGTWEDYEATHQRVVPGIGEVNGLRGRIVARDVDRPDTGYSISLWDSLEAMQSYEQGPLAAVMSELEPYFGGEFATQRCELRRREGFGD